MYDCQCSKPFQIRMAHTTCTHNTSTYLKSISTILVRNWELHTMHQLCVTPTDKVYRSLLYWATGEHWVEDGEWKGDSECMSLHYWHLFVRPTTWSHIQNTNIALQTLLREYHVRRWLCWPELHLDPMFDCNCTNIIYTNAPSIFM